MPKGFTEKQRENIQKALLNTGKTLFSQYGLNKTSIGDLTKAVGISQGAFYQFYPSKEMLYYTVLKEEEIYIKAQLFREVDFKVDDLKENIKKLMLWTLDLAENNPFIKQLMSLRELDAVIESVPETTSSEHQSEDEDFFKSLLSLWQADEQMIAISTDILVGIFGVIFTLPLNKKIIGESNYVETRLFLVDALAEALVKKPEI